jgi:hypothetical protein
VCREELGRGAIDRARERDRGLGEGHEWSGWGGGRRGSSAGDDEWRPTAQTRAGEEESARRE